MRLILQTPKCVNFYGAELSKRTLLLRLTFAQDNSVYSKHKQHHKTSTLILHRNTSTHMCCRGALQCAPTNRITNRRLLFLTHLHPFLLVILQIFRRDHIEAAIHDGGNFFVVDGFY